LYSAGSARQTSSLFAEENRIDRMSKTQAVIVFIQAMLV
jgi:hypothetical protein